MTSDTQLNIVNRAYLSLNKFKLFFRLLQHT